ncbi:hypothetical protein [Sphingomonas morindae]|uniref:Uncharacterized protein n=1 Tax=Sphingomonas morindae TaxID=1541170 RepID=A0ABY4X546_9SPHN|nr:hypothetical protein [Sphingomonas morindae]USI72019.1 hypothetical protein LHA26_11950 [Sphingomonas morindae]
MMGIFPDPGNFRNPFSHESGDVHADVLLHIAVRDRAALWRAAYQRLLAAGLTPEEITACIGPVEDAAVDDCLYAMLLPLELPGCIPTDVTVRNLGAMPPPAPLPHGRAPERPR